MDKISLIVFRCVCLVFFLLSLIFAPAPCRAQDKLFSSPELAVSAERFKSGSDVLAVLRLEFQPSWHAYAHDEKRGKPTTLSFSGLSLADTARVEVFYPRGEPENDVLDPKRKVYVYNGTTGIFVLFKEGIKAKSLNAGLDLLLCSAQSCMPVKAEFALPAPFGGDLPDIAARPEIKSAWEKALPGAPPALKTTHLPLPAPNELKLAPRFYNSGLEVSALGKAVFLGLLAGFLLNVMPCVLPVITLKASALLIVSAQKDLAHKASVMRRYSLFFALGILSFFMLLALLAGVAGQMWGQSFQNPEAVHGMAALVFLLGASLFGAFTLPIIDLKAVSGFSASQAYFTGLFTTLLATPCSGPLLGGVLGWSFTQPALSRAVVFAAIGLGMALPHFFMACRPGVAVLLPRPGAWMGVVEKMVGFFLLGVGLYLVSILPAVMHMPVLAGVLFMVFGSWIWGRFGGLRAPTKARRRAVGLLAGCVIALGALLPYQGGTPAPLWENFDYKSFQAALGKENMLLDFTADWCPNCKLLESTALGAENAANWQKRFNLRLIKVDLTLGNEEGKKLLNALKSGSIPLVAVFPAGKDARAPIVLRDIFTAGQLERALGGALEAVSK